MIVHTENHSLVMKPRRRGTRYIMAGIVIAADLAAVGRLWRVFPRHFVRAQTDGENAERSEDDSGNGEKDGLSLNRQQMNKAQQMMNRTEINSSRCLSGD